MSGKSSRGWGRWSVSENSSECVCHVKGCMEKRIQITDLSTIRKRYEVLQSLKTTRITQMGQQEVQPDWDVNGFRRVLADLFPADEDVFHGIPIIKDAAED